MSKNKAIRSSETKALIAALEDIVLGGDCSIYHLVLLGDNLTKRLI